MWRKTRWWMRPMIASANGDQYQPGKTSSS
jgi:hypothetical protein